jgi:hypothetical protein
LAWTITKNCVGFLKLHLKHPLKDRLALLRGEDAFVMELEGGEHVIGKIEKGFELVTKGETFDSTSNVTTTTPYHI